MAIFGDLIRTGRSIRKRKSQKKYGFFQQDKDFFLEVADELGLRQTREGRDVGFARHPLTFLVEAADDICYTIIDFEDGINLGLIDEDFALEYLINLVKATIDALSKLKSPAEIARLRGISLEKVFNG